MTSGREGRGGGAYGLLLELSDCIVFLFQFQIVSLESLQASRGYFLKRQVLVGCSTLCDRSVRVRLTSPGSQAALPSIFFFFTPCEKNWSVESGNAGRLQWYNFFCLCWCKTAA